MFPIPDRKLHPAQVELIAEEQESPFGFDGDDLPLERYCETIRANAREILGL